MKQRIISLIASVFILLSSYGQRQIRNADWGWPKDSVKMTEVLKLYSETKDGVVYEGNIMGKDFLISYDFIKNRLVRVTYLYAEKHVNKNNYITAYGNMKDVLTEKYGDNISNKTLWKSDLYKDKYSSWGLACSAGHVTFRTEWITKDANIILVCTGENFEISLGILYTSKKFSHLIDNKEQEQNFKDF